MKNGSTAASSASAATAASPQRTAAVPAPPPDVARLLDEVREMLAAGKTKQALAALSRDETETLITQARVKAGWIKEEDLVRPAAEEAAAEPEEAQA